MKTNESHPSGLIWTCYHRNQLKAVIGGSFLALAGIIGIGLAVYFALPAERLLFHFLSITIFIWGQYLIITGVRRLKPQAHPFFGKAYLNPEKVVWVYHGKVTSIPFGVKLFERASIHFFMIDGSSDVLLVHPKTVQTVIDSCRLNFFKATFGYDKLKEQLFKVSPSLLLNDQPL